MQAREWRFTPPRSAEREALARELGVSTVTAQVLLNRGVGEAVAARRFINPALGQLSEPQELCGMRPAAQRLARALRDGEPLAIHADYDVDGLTSAAILLRFLRLFDRTAEVCIPNRLEEGYGLQAAGAQAIIASGARLALAVDNGVSSHAAAELLAHAGVDLIIVDHHEPAAGPLPPAVAIIDPKQPGCPSREKHLCAAGLVFKLVWATALEFSRTQRVNQTFRDFLLEAVGLAGLATIADVVPLLGENRVLAAQGLEILQRGAHPGLTALARVAQVKREGTRRRWTCEDVAFRLAPRLNAAGRLGDAHRALALLQATTEAEAVLLAAELDRANRERQRIEGRVLREAQAAAADETAAGAPALVLAGAGWHVGVLGIVASRLLEEFGRPAALAGWPEAGDAPGRGSVRSRSGFSVAEALHRSSAHLESCGGHARAGGFSVRREKWDGFRGAFLEQAAAAAGGAGAAAAEPLAIDAEVPFALLELDLARELEGFAPFGEANPEPLLAAVGLRVAGAIRPLGARGEHLAFHVRDGTARAVRAIAFKAGARYEELCALAGNGNGHGRRLDLAFHLRRDDYRGGGAVELVLSDFRAAAE